MSGRKKQTFNLYTTKFRSNGFLQTAFYKTITLIKHVHNIEILVELSAIQPPLAYSRVMEPHYFY